jgi:amino acid adenylation domain-containing protein
MSTASLTGFALSPQQQRLWRLHGPGCAPGFVVQGSIEIVGPLDRDRLWSALDQVVARHEVLRTTFPVLPGMLLPVQAVAETAAVDRSEHHLDAAEGLTALLREVRSIPFDLAAGPLLRTALAALEPDRHHLLVTLPAVAADAASIGVLAAEIAAAYAGEDQGEPPLQYVDASGIFEEWLGPIEGEEGSSYWRLQDLSVLSHLARRSGEGLSAAPPSAPQPFVPQTVAARLDLDGAGAMLRLAEQMGLPPSVVALAGWSAALWQTTGEEALMIGTGFDGRTCAEFETALGPYTRYLPVLCRLGPGATLAGIADTLQRTMAEAAAHQDFFPPELADEALGLGTGGWPFGFDYEPAAVLQEAARGSVTFQAHTVSAGLDRFDLRLSVRQERDGSLSFALEHDPAVYETAAAARLLARTVRGIAALSVEPHREIADFDPLSEEESDELLIRFNATARESAVPRTARDLFAEAARQSPEAPAVTSGGLVRSQAELRRRVLRLAGHLAAQGIGPEARVGVCLERSPGSTRVVEALLAVLEAGGAYVPLDPGHPAERLAFLLEDSGASILLTEERLLPRLPSPVRARVLCLETLESDAEAALPDFAAPPVDPDNLAYVIYTSGSTGRPKGVMVPHRSLVSYLLWAMEAYRAQEGNGAPVHSAVGFDLTVTSLFVPLAAGRCIELLPEEQGVSALAATLREGRDFSLVKLTPAHLEALRQVLSPEEIGGCARALVIGGEALRAESLALFRQAAPDTRLINEYGPTEATVGCCVYEVGPADPAAGPVPIGRPITGTRLYVVGPRRLPVPAGAPGELWIGGDGLTRGYLGRPDLTAERFVPDPFGPPGGRIYRTGDRVRLRPDGHLEFLGRLDDQVKIRGHRIELGEVEVALAAHPAIGGVAVAAPGEGSERRLVAYYVPRGKAPAAEELRTFLGRQLPEPMVPSAFVALEALPLTAHGKVDRRALPDPRETGLREAPYSPPRTLTEEVLAEIFARVAGVERVGIDDSFFALGGDSIRSLQVLALAQKRGLSVTLQDLFRSPTIRGLSESVRLDGAAGSEAPPAPFSLISAMDRERLDPGLEDAYPLTRLQAGMLYHSELDPDSAVYHDLHSAQLHGRYDAELLATVIGQVVRRHPLLRTSFDLTGFSEPLQLVHRQVEIPLATDDLRHLSVEEGRRIALAWLDREAFQPFDWSRAPLARFQIHLFGDGSFQFTLSFHHSILDGWSAASLLTELFRRYVSLLDDAACPEEAPPGATLRELVHLERSVLASAEAREFWRRHLEDSPLVRLPRTRRETAGRRADPLWAPLPLDLSDGLKQVARSLALPLKSVLMAVHFRVLGLLSGLTDVVSGVISNGRPERPDGEQAIGLFLNTLPLRMTLPGGSWSDLAHAAFELERASLPFRRFPLAELQQMEGGRTLFEIAFNFLHFHVYDSLNELTGLDVVSREGYEETNFSLITHFQLSGASQLIHLNLSYQMAEHDREEMEVVARRYMVALEAMAMAPQAAYETQTLFTEAERAQLLAWNETARPMRLPLLVHEIFEAQAERTPEASAVEMNGARLTYRELDRRAGRLARSLRAAGVGPDDPVGMCLERSLAVPVAVLGILKAGGAYLPLDPAYPAERLAAMADDARLRWLVCDESTLGRLTSGLREGRSTQLLGPAGEMEGDRNGQEHDGLPPLALAPDHLAYVLYTSGSTGRPKGVAMPHSPLSNLIDWQLAATTAPGTRRTAQFSALSFDVSFQEMFTAWAQGGTLVVLSEAVRRDSGTLLQLLAERSVEQLFLPFVALQQLADEATAGGVLPHSLREVITAGEQLQATAAVRELFRRLPGCRLVNAYGPTETHVVTAFTLPESPDAWPPLPPIGPPIANLRARVLDASLQPVLPGVPGEIFFGGAGLARGYIGRPDLTAERFLPDPQVAEPGERVYRTGDLARYLPDGGIEFLGRTDHQVKVRGFRVEPGEIETALAHHPGVREAAVVVREASGPGDRRLVGYVVPRGRSAAEAGDAFAGELRAFLAGRLPEHMVPWTIVPLDAFPLTPSGKLDRRSLPAPGAARRLGADLTPPRGPIEESVAAFWAEVLGSGPVGIHESFFELGGHSLLATRVMSRVRAAFGIELPLRVLFEEPTVAGLAAAVEGVLRAGAPPVPPLVPVPRDGDLPLSFAQQRLWFLDQLLPGDPAYSLPFALRLVGALAPEALAMSFGALVARHEILRTTFAVRDGEPVQRIAPPAPVPVPLHDLAGLPPEHAQTEVHRLAAEDARRPFDLARGPLLRVRLVRLGDREHALLLNLHHIVADAWSMGVLIRELTALYTSFTRSTAALLPELPVQYADYAVWQRDWLRGEALEAQLAWWRGELAGASPALGLPFDRPRPAVSGHRGGQVGLALPEDLAAALGALSRRQGATLFMTLLAAWSALLSRSAAQDDVLVGSAIANRTRLETESLIGFFVNTLVLRTDLSGNPGFGELVARIRRATLGAYDHQDLPFERLVEELAPERSLNRSPLFQVMFGLQNAPAEAFEMAELELRPLRLAGETAKFDLTLSLVEVPAGLHAGLGYNSDLFDRATAERLLGGFGALLAGAVADPAKRFSELPLLSAAEREQLAAAAEASRHAAPDVALAVPAAFAELAERMPAAVAVTGSGADLTFGELRRWSRRLAGMLRREGVGAEHRVAICAEPSAALVAGILAVLEAGGAWVPLDPAHPDERLSAMLADSGASLLLTPERLAGRVAGLGARTLLLDAMEPTAGPAGDSGEDPVAVPLEAAAYVIYTSGTTGRPKGTVVSHRSLAGYLDWFNRRFAATGTRPLPCISSPGFDASLKQLLAPLLRGEAVWIVPPGTESQPDRLLAEIAARGGAALNCVPSLWRVLLEQIEAGERVEGAPRHLLLGGEALDPALAERTLAAIPGIEIWNLYGPTEATANASCFRVESPRIGIGSGVAGAILHVVDRHLQLVPPGMAGELAIAGNGLARGYLGLPAVTAERFVPNPFAFEPGERIYRTGDRARGLPDGGLELLGRLDRQVKIRGFRLEPGEVEAALSRHPSVAQAVVAAWGSAPEELRLAAWVVPAAGAAPDPADLRAHLRATLPEPMVPSAWTLLPTLPLTPNGKVDRAALPPPDRASVATTVYEEPRTAAEREIAEIWRDLLGAERVGLHDNFFDLGGHSLLMVRVQGRISRQLGREITMVDLFSHPTVSSLARLLTGAAESDAVPLRSAEQEERMAGSKERMRRLRQGHDRKVR